MAFWGVAALSAVEAENKAVSTIEFKINYLSTVFLGDKLKGVGVVLRKGKRILLAEGKIYNQKNELVATATGAFNAYSFEKSDMFE
ncbi:PaaI family thioesterase [Flavobacteriales bacterium]|nr:PaaI family thioesterase [Flavobacteriales bacterium]